jgi:energy-coupling factor transport system permease protein
MRPLYQFSAGDSFAHRLDPRTKLIFVVCYMVAAFVVPQPWWMFIAVIFIIWVLGGIKPSAYAIFIVYMAPLMITLTVIQMLTGPKPPGMMILGYEIPFLSQAGWDIGIRIAFRLLTTGVGFILFSMTTDPFDTGLSLYQSGLPYRISYMFAFALRFFPLLQEELFVIRSALQARAYAAVGSNNPYTIIKGMTTAVVPLGVGALRRSQDIALAMERRGLGFPTELGIQRVIFRDIRLRFWDYIIIAFSVIGLITVIALYGWGGKAWVVLPDQTWMFMKIVLGSSIS